MMLYTPCVLPPVPGGAWIANGVMVSYHVSAMSWSSDSTLSVEKDRTSPSLSNSASTIRREVSENGGLIIDSISSCSHRASATLSEYATTSLLVRSERMKSACPGPAGEKSTRQWLATVVNSAPLGRRQPDKRILSRDPYLVRVHHRCRPPPLRLVQ